MDIPTYRRVLAELIKEALENSDGTTRGVSEYLDNKKIPRFLVRNRKEKLRALSEAREAFDEHMVWPVDIVISHLGVDREDLEKLSS
jgi:hypothetical protein